MLYGYVRVSKQNWEKYINDIDDKQREIIHEAAKIQFDGKVDHIFSEITEPVAPLSTRRELTKLIDKLSQGDIILVSSIDIIALSVDIYNEIVSKVLQKGAEIYICQNNARIDCPNVAIYYAEIVRFLSNDKAKGICRINGEIVPPKPNKYVMSF